MDNIEQSYLDMKSASAAETEHSGRDRSRVVRRRQSDAVKAASGDASDNGLDASRLLKLRKKDLLEIMLKQGQEIDKLRDKVAELEEKLESKEITIDNAGSLAEASLALTAIFEEAQKAADIYLSNVSRISSDRREDLYAGGDGSDE